MLKQQEYEQQEWIFILDIPLMEEYWLYYKKNHPRSIKHPLQPDSKVKNLTPYPPSLNRILIMKNRIQANVFKQQWSDFIEWACMGRGYCGLNLDKIKIKVDFYFKDKRPHDILDNYCLKYISDGFVKCNFLKDDNNKVVQRAIYSYKGIDKEHPRTEIKIIKLKDGEYIN